MSRTPFVLKVPAGLASGARALLSSLLILSSWVPLRASGYAAPAVIYRDLADGRPCSGCPDSAGQRGIEHQEAHYCFCWGSGRARLIVEREGLVHEAWASDSATHTRPCGYRQPIMAFADMNGKGSLDAVLLYPLVSWCWHKGYVYKPEIHMILDGRHASTLNDLPEVRWGPGIPDSLEPADHEVDLVFGRRGNGSTEVLVLLLDHDHDNHAAGRKHVVWRVDNKSASFVRSIYRKISIDRLLAELTAEYASFIVERY